MDQVKRTCITFWVVNLPLQWNSFDVLSHTAFVHVGQYNMQDGRIKTCILFYNYNKGNVKSLERNASDLFKRMYSSWLWLCSSPIATVAAKTQESQRKYMRVAQRFCDLSYSCIVVPLIHNKLAWTWGKGWIRWPP